jgi:hypothetical protein
MRSGAVDGKASQAYVVSLGGLTKAGGGTGVTVIVCGCVVVLPQLSVIVQVLIKVPPVHGSVIIPVWVGITSPIPVQLSVHMMGYNALVSLTQDSVLSAGIVTNMGKSSSTKLKGISVTAQHSGATAVQLVNVEALSPTAGGV